MSQSLLLDESGGADSHEYTIEVHGISRAMLQRLDERARQSGSDRSQIIQWILAKELENEPTPLTMSPFDAALAPIRQGFSESGLSEDEATSLLEDGLRAVRQGMATERNGR
ncbi:MAG: hypothetical protein M3Y56_12950 [Armatimonadota bacterium]|nr:hypothetical protein [Armatimonadota bacterium]